MRAEEEILDKRMTLCGRPGWWRRGWVIGRVGGDEMEQGGITVRAVFRKREDECGGSGWVGGKNIRRGHGKGRR